MEIRKGGQTLVGFPALIDRGTHVEIEVFDEPDVAAAQHRAGLRRLVALQIREPLKYLEKNIPDLTKMAAAYMPLGTLEELREQIIDVALDRAFLADPLPTDERSFKAPPRRRPRAPEPDRAGGGPPGRRRCCPSTPPPAASSRTASRRKEVADDISAQLQRLVPQALPGCSTPWAQLQHLPRYLKARRAAAGQAARRPGARRRSGWPNCARWSSAGCAALAELQGAPMRGWTNTAGCWRNCASASSRRNCARRSR